MREALRRLAALGLVSFAPNKSVRVRTLSREELREAFLVRAELESLATELAVANMIDEDFAALEAAERRFAELTEALLDRDEPERARLTADWVAANQAFHDVIYRAARSPLVERTAKSMRRTFLGQAVWRAGGHEIDDLYRKNVVQHRAICNALYARSAEGARSLAREHVMSSCRLLEVILDAMGRRPSAAA